MATYIVSDLHGQLPLWREIQKKLNTNDKLYCLGDCIDRGKDGIIILKEMMEDERVTLIKGNHEDMMVTTIRRLVKRYGSEAPTIKDYLKAVNESYGSAMFNLQKDIWIGFNGGKETFDYLLYHYDEMDVDDFIQKVDELPDRIDIQTEDGKTIVLTHAGCNPWETEEERRHYCSEGTKVNPYIWDRNHIFDGGFLPEEYENTYIIHGHTPVLLSSYFGAMWRYNTYEMQDPNNWTIIKYYLDHKICIDMGAFFTRMTCLFNVDKWKAEYIYDSNYYEFTRPESNILKIKQPLE